MSSCGGDQVAPSEVFLGTLDSSMVGPHISAQDILLDCMNVAVEKFPTPTTVRSVRELFCLVSYYRLFVVHFAGVAGRPTMLTHADAPLLRTEACEMASTHFT